MKRLIVFLLVCSLLSCKNNEASNSIPIIKQEEMFEILKEKYYILIYLNGCLACRDCKHRINKMDKDLKEDFYYLDLELNKGLSSSYFVSNIGVTSYKDLKIKKDHLLACIIRENNVIIPSGKDTLEPLDSVIIVTTNTSVKDVSDILE